MRDFFWNVQGWLEAAFEWTRDLARRILPHEEDSPDLRSLKLSVFLFVGIIGLMLIIGGITFGIAVRGQPETLVPNLQGKDVLDALMDLQGKELYADVQVQYSDTEKDIVLSQRPAPGTLVKAGKRVILRISKGPIIDKVENYIGMSLEDVKVHLQTMFASHSPNIIIKTPIIYQYRPGVPSGKVLAQSPAPNTKITGVASLELVVSQEQGAVSMVTVGDYVGKSFEEAIQELTRDNIPFAFDVKASAKGTNPGAVISQNPPKGSQADYGQVIQLTMSAPANVGKDNVFGLFKFSLPPEAIAVNIRLVLVSDSMPKEILSMKHPGGPLAVPYIVPEGSDLVLYVLDQEVAREKATAIHF
ncbi:MAG: PASTA domain-containing protein [Spirochaetia bacterium]|jgi:beta-lactam-binding protein with PASTA domain